MATRPGSWLGRLRIWLADKLDMYPDPGEAWCMKCSLSHGRTRVIAQSGIEAHVLTHPDGEEVYVRSHERMSPGET